MLQKLVVVKNLGTSIYSCYIATIIPSEENATKNSSKIDKTFYGGDPDSKFSGTVVYSTVTTNYTISVEKYANGTMVQQKSLFYASADLNEYVDEMSQLLNAGRIKRDVRAMTKNGEYGGEGSITLPEVIIVAPEPNPPPSLPPPNDPPVPEYPPGSYPPGYIPPTPPPYTGGGGGGSGGGAQPGSPQLSSPNPDYNEITQKINEILPEIFEILKKLGIDLNDYEIEIAVGCATAARKTADGTIGICASFINRGYTINNQASIIWHEIYHVDNDINCSLDEQKLPSAIGYTNIPPDMENYIRNDLYGDGVSGQYYVDEITVSTILSPDYYRNEIAA